MSYTKREKIRENKRILKIARRIGLKIDIVKIS